VPAFTNRSTAFFGKGDYERAIAHYSEAIRLKADFIVAYKNRAITKAGGMLSFMESIVGISQARVATPVTNSKAAEVSSSFHISLLSLSEAA
jgi:hypothetical protein